MLDVVPFELRVAAGMIDRDWQQVRADALAERDPWGAGVEAMIHGGSPNLQDDLRTYRDIYEQLIDRLVDMTDESDLFEAARSIPMAEAQRVGARINAAAQRACH